jgi:hypothetical protein
VADREHTKLLMFNPARKAYYSGAWVLCVFAIGPLAIFGTDWTNSAIRLYSERPTAASTQSYKLVTVKAKCLLIQNTNIFVTFINSFKKNFVLCICINVDLPEQSSTAVNFVHVLSRQHWPDWMPG